MFRYLIPLVFCLHLVRSDVPVWSWKCTRNSCEKERVTPGLEHLAVSLGECQLLCSHFGSLWPQPTGEVVIDKHLVPVDANNINIIESENKNIENSLIQNGIQLFKDKFRSLRMHKKNSDGKSLIITLIIEKPNISRLELDTDESYSLKVRETADNKINVTLDAPTYFGTRHGLETLGQLIFYNDVKEELYMPSSVSITDKPVYPYRGILLDTARNFVTVETIKRTIDGISASKLNTFHWHITDSQSFPYVSKSNPQLSKLGAYSKAKIYTPSDIADVIEYAKVRGVRVLPEFDAPAHVGEGWQDTDFIACFNKQPWTQYCVEPPCGQFDPTKQKLYDALEGIYKDMVEQFNPDIFHMGGDEVSLSCWNSTSSITAWMRETHGWGTSEEDFMKLWNLFQTQALERFDKQVGKKIPIIMWTSTLTKKQYVERFLPKDRYIIQIWTDILDQQIKDLLQKGYKLILSNYDVLYLDCGFAGWVNDGSNWCSPYKGWQKIYENGPAKFGGIHKNQFLGAEAALWTEQVDDTSIDSRIWPRAAALAERLWAEPTTSWRDAEARMLIHRERLVNRGINADALVPLWCVQNEENCPIKSKYN